MIYERRGLAKELAMTVAEQLSAHDPLGAHMHDELGIDRSALSEPFQAAWISAASFASFALVPIVAYCFDKGGKHLTDAEIRKVVKWFYYSQIRTRYVSQLPQKLDRDLRTIKESKNPFDELLAVIEEERRLEITPDELASMMQLPLMEVVPRLARSLPHVPFHRPQSLSLTQENPQ